MDDNLNKMLNIIANNILTARKNKGVTQEELAFSAGIDRTYIGYIENSKHNVTLGMLLKIASALDIGLLDLFAVEDLNTDIDKMNELFPYIRKYQKLAEDSNGINDVFQDNGGKLLLLLSSEINNTL